MAEQHSEPKVPGVKPFLFISLVGLVVVYLSWQYREGLGNAVWLPLLMGGLFAGAGILATVWSIKLAILKRTPALPAAPAEYVGTFAPDFRRNLEKLYAALPKDSYEMTLEEDYAFWYNKEQSVELVLTPEGWLGFYVFHAGTYSMAPELVQRAVADSPFASLSSAQELVLKYADMPLCGIAWYCGGKLVVYPYDAAEEFTRFYADNLFAPASAFDSWLKFYRETGMMHESES
ncbi:MAG: hypothetical protein IJE66_00435 [Akkermansia sp.]|nr:hypothetical protein [Akkermansia sp.]